MAKSITDRIQHAWNILRDRAPENYHTYGYGSTSKPDRVRLSFGNEKSIVASIYNRIAMDVAAVNIKHVRLDENGRYAETMQSSLNTCLSLRANKDQTARAFIQDAVVSLFDEGAIAIVPVDITSTPDEPLKIETVRTAKILEWYPDRVRIRLYNDLTGRQEEITVLKSEVAIIENPLYAVMNEPNSTLKRLIHKLNLLDAIDNQSASGKLDVIIQLPFAIKGESRRNMAEERKKNIEMQLTGSKYGIAYIDSTEKITQLNRPAENNLMSQIEYLTRTLYSQLGMTESVFDGTADEKTMLNYINRTIEPVLAAIIEPMIISFLTKTARTQRQTIMYFRDPFKLVPISEMANIADKFTRNEILSTNDIRSVMGFKPDSNPKSDELRNKNLNPTDGSNINNTDSKGETGNG